MTPGTPHPLPTSRCHLRDGERRATWTRRLTTCSRSSDDTRETGGEEGSRLSEQQRLDRRAPLTPGSRSHATTCTARRCSKLNSSINSSVAARGRCALPSSLVPPLPHQSCSHGWIVSATATARGSPAAGTRRSRFPGVSLEPTVNGAVTCLPQGKAANAA